MESRTITARSPKGYLRGFGPFFDIRETLKCKDELITHGWSEILVIQDTV
jgi:hypothetical protein